MKNNVYCIMIIIISFLVVAVHADCEQSKINNINYDFNKNNGVYTLNAKIFIKSDIASVTRLLYEFSSVKRFFQSALSTEIISQSKNYYDMRLYYKYWIFEAEVVYRRILNINENKIYFKMISFKANSKLLPEVLSSEGYYEFVNEGSGVLLTLHNYTVLKSYLPILDSLLIRKEDAFTYLEKVKNYAEKGDNK